MARRERDLVGVCTECKSDQSENYMKRNPFFIQGIVSTSGGGATCQWCGGLVIIVDRAERDDALARHDSKRGLG